MNTAYTDLLKQLGRDEKVEYVKFIYYMGYYDENPYDVPLETLLTFEQAIPHLSKEWRFIKEEYGSPKTYYTYIWSNKYVYYTWEYDGQTALHSIPRNPV